MDNNHNDQKVTKKKQRKKKKRKKKDSRNMVVESFVDHQTSRAKRNQEFHTGNPSAQRFPDACNHAGILGILLGGPGEKGRESARKLEICHR